MLENYKIDGDKIDGVMMEMLIEIKARLLGIESLLLLNAKTTTGEDISREEHDKCINFYIKDVKNKLYEEHGSIEDAIKDE